MIWCILIPLLVGLLCALLGYLLGRNSAKKEVEKWKEKVTGLEADLEACNKSKISLKNQHTNDLNIWRDKSTKLEADVKTKEENLNIWNTKFSKLETDSKLSLQSKTDELSALKSKIAQLEKDLENCNKNSAALKTESGDLDVWENKVAKLEKELEESNKAKLKLTADLSACIQSKSSLETDLTSANNSIASSLAAIATLPFDGDAAKAVFGKKIKQDDLKVVEGIGPKIEGLFHNFDIKTWKALSEASLEKCQEVLNSGGDRYKIHNPGTWSQQAKLAYEGKWAELLKWQDELDGGKA